MSSATRNSRSVSRAGMPPRPLSAADPMKLTFRHRHSAAPNSPKKPPKSGRRTDGPDETKKSTCPISLPCLGAKITKYTPCPPVFDRPDSIAPVCFPTKSQSFPSCTALFGSKISGFSLLDLLVWVQKFAILGQSPIMPRGCKIARSFLPHIRPKFLSRPNRSRPNPGMPTERCRPGTAGWKPEVTGMPATRPLTLRDSLAIRRQRCGWRRQRAKDVVRWATPRRVGPASGKSRARMASRFSVVVTGWSPSPMPEDRTINPPHRPPAL